MAPCLGPLRGLWRVKMPPAIVFVPRRAYGLSLRISLARQVNWGRRASRRTAVAAKMRADIIRTRIDG